MVLALLAILAGFSTHFLHKFADRFAVDGAAKRLYFDLLKAKTKALEKNTCYGIKFNYPTGFDYSLVEVSCGTGSISQTIQSINLAHDYGPYIIKTISPSSPSVIYYPNGLCRGCQMSANFTSTRISYLVTVRVNGMGRVKIYGQ